MPKHLKWTEYQGKAKIQKFQIGMALSASQWDGNRSFKFLNKEVSFSQSIDWNYSSNGKLWTYNLNYFEFLGASSREQGVEILKNFIEFYPNVLDGREPYPTALRLINTVKFCCQNSLEDSKINSLLYSDGCNLMYNLEYHLLGNHLLEDGFGLLFAGLYLQEKSFLNKGHGIILKELKEQYQEDGLHYEQSPMYHSILLERMLDSIVILRVYDGPKDLLQALVKTAESALSFLDWCTIKDYYPLWNDAALGIAKRPSQIFEYAKSLQISWNELIQAGESGYRRLSKDSLDIYFDAGKVGPDYQPGHAHADTLSIDLFSNGHPIVVDPGTSTYEIGNRRTLERSTAFHNTITINNQNSSAVWGGFRTAQRARVKIDYESTDKIIASHYGYKGLKIIHQRTIKALSKGFSIEDEIMGNEEIESMFSLHFHPNCILELKDNFIKVNHDIQMEFTGLKNIQILDYQYAGGFNKLQPAKKIVGICTHSINCTITLEEDYEN